MEKHEILTMLWVFALLRLWIIKSHFSCAGWRLIRRMNGIHGNH